MLFLLVAFLGSRIRHSSCQHVKEDGRIFNLCLTRPVDADSVTKLQDLFSLSASQILELKGLDSVGACLNDLAANGRLDNATITRASSMLERTQEYFDIFERALRAEDDWKAAMSKQ